MSAAFARGKGKKLSIYIPCRTGLIQRSTGTSNPTIARKMRDMVQKFRDDHEWELLDAIRARRLTLTVCYQHYASNRIPLLRDRLAAVNLADHLGAWEASVRATLGETGTAEDYRTKVSSLVTDPFTPAQLRPAAISAWLAGLTVTPGTRRHFYYALSSFIKHCMAAGVLDANPLDRVAVPKKNAARLRWELEDVDQRIVNAAPEKYRALFAFVHATGAEVSAALSAQRRDFDLERGVCRIRGTKTATRDRHECLIEPWAQSILLLHCCDMQPAAKVWEGITRYMAHAHHQATCKKLGVDDYTLRDSRHSIAVRARKAGKSLEWIAEQLGHKNTYQAATVYGKFTLTTDERLAEGSAPQTPEKRQFTTDRTTSGQPRLTSDGATGDVGDRLSSDETTR